MMTTAMPEAAKDPEISRVVRESMESLERAMERRFRKAIDEGQIAADTDTHALAMILVANHYELSAPCPCRLFAPGAARAADRAQDLIRSIVRPRG